MTYFSKNLFKTIPLIKEAKRFNNMDTLWANFICSKTQKPDDLLWITAALTNYHSRQGNSFLPLSHYAKKSLFKENDSFIFPDLENWIACFKKHPNIIGKDPMLSPLIFEEPHCLYKQLYYVLEKKLASFFKKKSQQKKNITHHFKKIWEDFFLQDNTTSDEQKIAIYTALSRYLTIISGYPGTGKTTIISKIISLYSKIKNQNYSKIILLAPTGKAVSRLKETFQIANKSNSLENSFFSIINENTLTIHRFLKKYKKNQQLHIHETFDLLIVDEVSMVPLSLMYELSLILQEDTQLVLLGDKNQLFSIEAASLMKDLTTLSQKNSCSKSFLEEIKPFVSIKENLLETNESNVLKDNLVLLTNSYRFKETSHISRLTYLINEQKIESLNQLLNEENASQPFFYEIKTQNDLKKTLEKLLIRHYQSFFNLVKTKKHYDLSSFFDWGILCAFKKGMFGAENINSFIEQLLFKRKIIEVDSFKKENLSYEGKPIMIIENDYSYNLFNGDIGFLLKNKDGKKEAFFQRSGSQSQFFSPYLIGKYQSFYASTVHKSQGSEFNHVIFILPEKNNDLLTKELIYTAISRAKKSVFILGKKEVFIQGVNQKINRSSNLRKRIES